MTRYARAGTQEEEAPNFFERPEALNSYRYFCVIIIPCIIVDRVIYKAVKTIEPLDADGVWVKLLDSRTATWISSMLEWRYTS